MFVWLGAKSAGDLRIEVHSAFTSTSRQTNGQAVCQLVGQIHEQSAGGTLSKPSGSRLKLSQSRAGHILTQGDIASGFRHAFALSSGGQVKAPYASNTISKSNSSSSSFSASKWGYLRSLCQLPAS